MREACYYAAALYLLLEREFMNHILLKNRENDVDYETIARNTNFYLIDRCKIICY